MIDCNYSGYRGKDPNLRCHDMTPQIRGLPHDGWAVTFHYPLVIIEITVSKKNKEEYDYNGKI
jgi:hypothetical protein